jgi:exodeoxyribonuclease VII large subunit
MIKILSISELTRDLKEVLENVFSEVAVEGEISNLSEPASGHKYFSLKDEAASLKCVIFKGGSLCLKFALKDGLKVVARGRVGVYERSGQYQLYIDSLEPKGAGALQVAFEQLKQKLAAEGLFEEARKRPLPFLPRAIGIVTSPTGAVIHDMLRIWARRFPDFHAVVAPARVQGDGAAREIAEGIALLNEVEGVEVIIVARGGGSLEDLWAFNEETVARAIAASSLPVISAVGHETDFTISDFVADLRAPTPSAAAELALPIQEDLLGRVRELLQRVRRSLTDYVPQNAQRLDELCGSMDRAMDRALKTEETRLHEFREKIERALLQIFRTEEVHLRGVLDALNALSPLAVLRRGYSVTTLEGDERAIQDAPW